MGDNRTVWQEVVTNKKSRHVCIYIVQCECTKQLELREKYRNILQKFILPMCFLKTILGQSCEVKICFCSLGRCEEAVEQRRPLVFQETHGRLPIGM